MKITSSHVTALNGQHMIVHSLPGASRIILNYPGRGSTIDGFNNKYQTLAQLMVEKGLGAVIQMENRDIPPTLDSRNVNDDRAYGQQIVTDLQVAVFYALGHKEVLGARPEAELCLMGASAGASAIAAMSGQHSSIKKILLLEPSGNAGAKAMKYGLGGYGGDICIVTGSEEAGAIGEKFGREVLGWAHKAKRKELVVLPNCDHQFKGKENGLIFSKAPFWAFAEDKSFPSPEGGIVLY